MTDTNSNTHPRLGAGHIIPSLDAPREEVLQFIYDRLKEQGTYSVKNAGCQYRADHTPHCRTRCAFGWLIPDDEYHPDMEGTSAVSRKLAHFIPSSLFSGAAFQAQAIHDGCYAQSTPYSQMLSLFANEFGIPTDKR